MSYLISFKIVILFSLSIYPSEILANEQFLTEEISIHTSSPVLITDRTQHSFTDDLPDLENVNDQSFKDNSNGQDGDPTSQSRPIPWEPGRFYIRTGKQNAANQGLVDVYDSMGLDYYHLTGIDINTTRVFYFRGHSYSDDDFVLGQTIHPGIISKQTYDQLEGSRELFFTLYYWTHYHYAPSIVNWHKDNQNDDSIAHINDQFMWLKDSDIKLMGQSLIVNNYKHYGQIRDQSISGLKKHEEIDKEAYQEIYNRVFSDDQIYQIVTTRNASSPSGFFHRYVLKEDSFFKFSYPYYKHYYGSSIGNSFYTNYIGVGEASVNLSEARLRSPRLWVEREAKDQNYPWLDLSTYNYWSPSKYNKFLIEEYAKFVFKENPDFDTFLSRRRSLFL